MQHLDVVRFDNYQVCILYELGPLEWFLLLQVHEKTSVMQQTLLTQYFGKPEGLEFRIVVREPDGAAWTYGVYSDPAVYQQIFRQLSDNLAQGLHIIVGYQLPKMGFDNQNFVKTTQETNTIDNFTPFSKFAYS
jgi:hypothetical protein